ncbi:hypothetical protein AX16_002498 [Volvariella volvacea WC 439]|nr:hypothetical protein AX16_002498 [Volvariella volvacea WC 439]
MLGIANNTRPEPQCGLALYFAIEALPRLMTPGNKQELQMILNKLLEHDIINVMLNFASNNRYVIGRHGAVEALRLMSSENFLGSRLSPGQTCDIIIIAICRFVLNGRQPFIDQMSDPSLVWQNTVCVPGPDSTTVEVASRYAPRLFDMTTEKALWAVHGLLCRDPPPTQQFCLKVVEHNREIIDLLLQSLALLIRGSFYSISGVPVPADEELQAQEAKEQQALLDTWKIVFTRPNWKDKILAIWKHVEEEDWEVVQAEDISTSDLLSFLKLAYTASLPLKNHGGDITKDYRHIERHYGISRFPLYTHFLGQDGTDPPIKVLDEVVAGPLALLHILIVLARRGLISTSTQSSIVNDIQPIAQWHTLPEGTIDIALNQLKQITSPAVVTKILSHASKQPPKRREYGNKALSKKQGITNALGEYMAGAALAKAIIDFTAEVKHNPNQDYGTVVKGVRKELVLCLGNASEMALRGNWLYRALMYGMSAV